MIDTQHVFVAQAAPALALPAQRSAYVFGAQDALGEAVLNQLLASGHYQRVYVSTVAALPSSVMHLHAFIEQDTFTLQDQAPAIDCFFALSESTSSKSDSAAVATVHSKTSRQSIYALLSLSQLPACLKHISIACSQTITAPSVQYCVFSRSVPFSDSAQCLEPYVQQSLGLVYGPESEQSNANQRGAYRFKPQSEGLLDRLGVWVLNVLSNVIHGMLNPDKRAPLTVVKTAQRLVQRFEQCAHTDEPGIVTITPDTLNPAVASRV